MWLFLRNLVFTILVPGTVAVFIPYRILRAQSVGLAPVWDLAAIVAVLLLALGALTYVWCVWDFAVTGRGTPNIVDAPRRLVVKGLYRYIRNPMYVGVLLVLLGWAALYRSTALYEYAGLMFVVFNLVVLLIEEPLLKRRFGQSYQAYCSNVGRWIPGRAYRPDDRQA